MAPVSVRSSDERGTLGNRVSAWIVDAAARRARSAPRGSSASRDAPTELKESKQALGAEVLTQAAEWTPSTLLSLGARNATRALPFNLVVTNVPGPQVPLYLLGARMLDNYPAGAARSTISALGIVLFSYAGKLCWGFNADWDLVPDLHAFVARRARRRSTSCARSRGARSPSRSGQAPRSARASSPRRRPASPPRRRLRSRNGSRSPHRSSPRGRRTVTSSPSPFPISARPSGDSIESRPSLGSDSSGRPAGTRRLSPDSSSTVDERAEVDAVAPRRRLAHDGERVELLLQEAQPAVDLAQPLLAVDVFGVLAAIAERGRVATSRVTRGRSTRHSRSASSCRRAKALGRDVAAHAAGVTERRRPGKPRLDRRAPRSLRCAACRPCSTECAAKRIARAWTQGVEIARAGGVTQERVSGGRARAARAAERPA